MSNLKLKHIYKTYPDGTKAVNDFCMEIGDNEFIVFVGPSGCGKSTTLRMIAGLEEISAGELYIDDELMNDVEPKDRDISMVFQNYALYPHMSVYDNMAFGLQLKHAPQEEIHKKVLWAADILKLTDYLDRKPRAMSGGQRQRVALGRAIIRNPKVFLLDEPLSNLDAKLRTEMRSEIAKLYKKLKTTFIYVTHDQVEAMTLGTRVVVMKSGYIQQIDTPKNLYNYPENKFVAGFIGTPQMNFFNCRLLRNGSNVSIKLNNTDNVLSIPFNKMLKVNPTYLSGEKDVILGIRCENISIVSSNDKKQDNTMKMKISHVEELGDEALIYGEINLNNDDFADTGTQIVVKTDDTSFEYEAGQIIDIAFDIEKVHYFDSETEYSICPRVPTVNSFDINIKDRVLTILDNKIELPEAIKIDNLDKTEMFIPTDAIELNGNIKAKVIEKERINNHDVIHLQTGERVFFILDKDLEVGKTINISFDLRKVTIKKDNKTIVEPLELVNKVQGLYTNLENNKLAIKSAINLRKENTTKQIDALTKEKDSELGKLGLNDYLIKNLDAECKEEIKALEFELSHKLGRTNLPPQGKKALKNDYKELIAKTKEKYSEKKKECAKVIEEAKKNKDSEKGNQIKEKYDSIISVAKENLSLYESVCNRGLDSLKPIATKDINESKEVLDKQLLEFNEQVKTNEDNYLKSDEYVSLNDSDKKAAIKKFKAENTARKDELITNSKVFYVSINGVYVKATPEMNKKIINALGSAVFSSNYRFEIGSESLFVDTEGFDAEVIDSVDYGANNLYIKAKALGDQFIVKVDKKYQEGEKIKINFKLDDIQIYENKYDIRLY